MTGWQGNFRAMVTREPIFMKDGAIWTSAGITAAIDLSLALVEEDHGHEVALKIARFLVMFLVRAGGQAQFSHMLSHRRSPQSRCANCKSGRSRTYAKILRSKNWRTGLG